MQKIGIIMEGLSIKTKSKLKEHLEWARVFYHYPLDVIPIDDFFRFVSYGCEDIDIITTIIENVIDWVDEQKLDTRSTINQDNAAERTIDYIKFIRDNLYEIVDIIRKEDMDDKNYVLLNGWKGQNAK